MKNKHSIITIGTFDGVHKGHQKLIKETVEKAKKKSLESIVIVIEKPVKNVSFLLTSTDEKINFIQDLHPDKIILIPNSSEILKETPLDFLNNFITGELNAKEIVCGPDFAFGKNRKGNVLWLKENAKKLGIEISVIKPLKYLSKKISSSHIRHLLENNNVDKANKILGRNFYFYGFPFREKGLGKKIGFPTINLKMDKSQVLPTGVFISIAAKKNKLYPSITNIGNRPTIKNIKTIIPEIHILNFNGKWGNKETKVYLIKRLRDEKKFSNIEELKKQIVKDKNAAERYFNL
ncbi:MAG: bifunctional riboflavin kinase/FAD synthetase [Elusimicrobiota bacterium]|jgi:riboflavin kinase/FMN adenylyltransferase|nr:bifunctional riboflavin kinase/FAD synthetase [Elusimicrobiota bacterium]